MSAAKSVHLTVIDRDNLEAALAESIADAEANKHKAWIIDCRKAIKENKARVAAAKADLDRAVDDLTNACTCLAEAIEPGSNIFKDIYGHKVTGGKSK